MYKYSLRKTKNLKFISETLDLSVLTWFFKSSEVYKMRPNKISLTRKRLMIIEQKVVVDETSKQNNKKIIV